MWQKLLIIFCLVVGYIIFHKITKEISKRVVCKKNNLSVSFGFQIVQSLVLIAVLIYICLQFEVTKEIYTSVLTNMSLIVVVLGFATQESIKNILSGIMIIRAKPFDIGQRIIIEEKNITGTVVNITLRHTVIQRFNNTTVIIPNSIMNSVIVENTTYNNDKTIANFLDVQVAYESDIDKAIKIVADVVKNHPNFIKEKEPNVIVRNLAAEGYDIRATVWTSSPAENFRACSDLRIQIKKAFDENNIEVPYNHMTVFQKNSQVNE